MRNFTLLLFILSLSLCAEAATEHNQQRLSGEPRLTVGLVLAGGGAKGAAHIGVLKKLEEMNIPVDYIAGTSIGAYVGGLYATGLSASEIETLFNTTDWTRGYVDRVERGGRSIHSKKKGDRYQVHADLGVGVSSIRAPSGVITGQSMLSIIRSSVGNVSTLDSFDELAIPYRAVATNIGTMEQSVFDSGYLPDAMMASMSIPGLLPPYEINGQRYVDGGVTNNMPVLAARTMGADVIIAIDVSSDFKSQSEIGGVMQVLDQLSIHMVKRSTELQINTLTVRDIYLKPDVGFIETTDFSAMPFALDRGYQAAESVASKLEAFAVSDAEYKAYQEGKLTKRHQFVKVDEMRVDKIEFKNQSHYMAETLSHHLDLGEGQAYSVEGLEQAVERIYALDSFEVVSYDLQEEADENTMIINVKEKPWGPNYLDFRLHIEEDFDQTSVYSIGATTHFTDLTTVGTEGWFGVDLGTTKRIDLEVLQPLSYGSTVSFGSGVHYVSDKGNVVFSSDGVEGELGDDGDYLPYTNKSLEGEVEINFSPLLWQEVTLGYDVESGETSLTPAPSFGDVDYDRRGVYASFVIDTLDDVMFPAAGFEVDFSWHQFDDEYRLLGRPEVSGNTTEFESMLRAVRSVNRHTLDAKIEYGVIDTEDDALALSPLRLGGFLNLSGMSRDSLAGKEKVYGSLTYRYRWFENDFGLFQSPVYLGLSAEQGSVWQDTDLSVRDIDLYRSNAVFVGVDSPLGALIFSYSKVHGGSDAAYLILGVPFP
ncbi:patatin-like phospholipase family protein [Vibrio gigantis]|uniref:patatin-like phospholipase family protein n=1 Tax=Vibrio gigantis TaxID=296199 RepID=UPI001BFE500B|nr:patatin-like phospholipase family protein [Vibrio gigantis]